MRHSLAAAIARALLIDRAQVAVILQRKVFTPDRRIIGIVGQFDDAEECVLRFLLPLHDVDEQRRGRRGAGRRQDRHGQDRTAAPTPHAASDLIRHDLPRSLADVGGAELHVADGSVTTDA